MYNGVGDYWKPSNSNTQIIDDKTYKDAFQSLMNNVNDIKQNNREYSANREMLESNYTQKIENFYNKAMKEGIGTDNSSQEGSGK